MERPLGVWIYSTLTLIGISISVLSTFLYLGPDMWPLMLVNSLLVIPMIPFLYLFFNLKKSSLLWLHVSFGLKAIVSSKTNPPSFVVVVLLWVLIARYINNKTVNGELVFKSQESNESS